MAAAEGVVVARRRPRQLLVDRLIATFANDVNGEIDRLNKPTRPLVTGELSMGEAWKFTILTYALGVVLYVVVVTAGGFWGAYILLSSRVGRGPTGRGGLAVAMGIATLLLVPAGIAEGGEALIDARLLAVAVGVAMLSSAIPYLAELEALRRLPAGTFGVLLSMEPAVAALVGLLALDQTLLPRELVAIALVVIASAGALSTDPAVSAAEV